MAPILVSVRKVALWLPNASNRIRESVNQHGIMSERRFLTNRARVLACIARDPGVTFRDIASTLDITEHSVVRIVDDLILGGYVTKEREGRRNRYHIQVDAPLDEALGRQQTIGDLLKVLVGSQSVRKQHSKRI